MLRRSRLTGLLLLVGTLVASAPAIAQDIHFEEASRGIERIEQTALLRTSFDALFVASRTGFYRYDNGIADWQRLPERPQIYGLSEPLDDLLFASTTGGLFRSTDRGETWLNVLSFAAPTRLAGRDDGTIIGTSNFGGERQNIAVSTNGGMSWDQERLPFSVPAAAAIVNLGDRFFMASHSGVKQTYNEGGVWETARLTDSIVNLIVTESGGLVAATGHSDRATQIWESSDSGTTWQLADSLPGCHLLTPGAGDRYWVGSSGLTETPDQTMFGLDHRQIGSDVRNRVMTTGGLQAISSGGNELVAAIDHQLFLFDTEGSEPRPLSGTLHDVPVDRIAVAPSSERESGDVYLLAPDRVLYGNIEPVTTHALYRSEDAGINWELVSTGLVGAQSVRNNQIPHPPLHADQFGNLYSARVRWHWNGAGTDYVTMRVFETVVSHDRGKSWEQVFPGVISEIREMPNGAIAIIGSDSSGIDPWPTITFSLDSGQTWQSLATVEPDGWANVAGSQFPQGIAFAEDGRLIAGFRWPTSNQGTDTGGIYRITLHEEGPVTIDGVDEHPTLSLVRRPDGSIVAASRRGVLRSENDGATWTEVNPRNDITRLLVFPGDVIWGQSSFFTRDGGETWNTQRVATRFGTIVPENGTDLLLLNAEALYRTNTGARTFSRPPTTRDPLEKIGLAIDSAGRIYLGSRTDAIHRSIDPSGVVETGHERNLDGITVGLLDRRLRITIDNDPSFTTTLFTIDGRRIPLNQITRSTASADYDISDIAAGAYVVVIERDERVNGVKVVVQ